MKRTAGRAVLAAIVLCAFATVPARAANLDFTFDGGAESVGEATAAAQWGPLTLSARHSEYLGFLNSAYRDGDGGQVMPADNPLRRSSLIAGHGNFDLPAAFNLEGGFRLGYEEWRRGNSDLTVTAETGLRISGLRLHHSLSATTSFAGAADTGRRGNGILNFGLDLFGGTQEIGLDYEAAPLARITGYRLNADWDLAGAGRTELGFSHDPLQAISTASFGFSQTLGPFEMASDITADSRGTYSLGIQFSLDLGSVEASDTWRLSSIVAAIRDRQEAAAAPVSVGLSDAPLQP